MSKYILPELYKSAFNCPHCGVLAKQTHSPFKIWPSNDYEAPIEFPGYKVSKCDHCWLPTLWREETVDYPNASMAPEALDEMPQELKVDFEEARKVLAISPRASAALLRLVVQKLCNILGDPKKPIDQNIGLMVKDGLPARMQQLLDTVRVTGNEAVHPGQMNLTDDRDTAILLFQIVNVVIEKLIVEPKKFAALYSNLPPEKLKGIENRDKQKI